MALTPPSNRWCEINWLTDKQAWASLIEEGNHDLKNSVRYFWNPIDRYFIIKYRAPINNLILNHVQSTQLEYTCIESKLVSEVSCPCLQSSLYEKNYFYDLKDPSLISIRFVPFVRVRIQKSWINFFHIFDIKEKLQ